MFELTIKGTTYQFNFGMGFMRRINKLMGTPIDGVPNVKKNVGLQYYIAGIMDKDMEYLVDILEAANVGQDPRVTREKLDAYIDDENTDVNELFDTVLDFLEKSNATKTVVANLKKAIAEEEAKRTAANQ